MNTGHATMTQQIAANPQRYMDELIEARAIIAELTAALRRIERDSADMRDDNYGAIVTVGFAGIHSIASAALAKVEGK